MSSDINVSWSNNGPCACTTLPLLLGSVVVTSRFTGEKTGLTPLNLPILRRIDDDLTCFIPFAEIHGRSPYGNLGARESLRYIDPVECDSRTDATMYSLSSALHVRSVYFAVRPRLLVHYVLLADDIRYCNPSFPHIAILSLFRFGTAKYLSSMLSQTHSD